MKGYVLSPSDETKIKSTLKTLKAKKRSLVGKIERNTADVFDNTQLDIINGQIAGIQYTLDVIKGTGKASIALAQIKVSLGW